MEQLNQYHSPSQDVQCDCLGITDHGPNDDELIDDRDPETLLIMKQELECYNL
jgi:hypothetical protein